MAQLLFDILERSGAQRGAGFLPPSLLVPAFPAMEPDTYDTYGDEPGDAEFGPSGDVLLDTLPVYERLDPETGLTDHDDGLTGPDLRQFWLEQRKDDPYHPLNMTRFLPDGQDDLLHALLPCQQQWVLRAAPEVGPIWIKVSRHRVERILAGAKWKVFHDGRGKRYLHRDVPGEHQYLHTFIMRQMLMEDATLCLAKCREFGGRKLRNFEGLSPEEQVDALMALGHVNHINHCTDDNSDENLDLVLPVDNIRQMSGSINTSGYTGVAWHKPSSKWQALVSTRAANGRSQRIYVGLFGSPLDAALARALFSLSRPGVLPAGSYSPPPHDRKLMRNVLSLLNTGFAPDYGWRADALQGNLRKWYLAACRRHEKTPFVLAACAAGA